jgi:alpha-ketoglutarate-dependent taurine dioxygenase
MHTEPCITLPGPQTQPLTPFGVLVQAPAAGTTLDALPIEPLRAMLLRERLIVLRGFARTAEQDALAEYCRRWGELLAWDFGTVFEVVEHAAPKNYLFTSGSVPYHWDGAFAAQVPWLQFFQCLESPGADAGGETIFCDTARIWQAAPPERRAQWERVAIEYSSDKVAHYGGRIRAPLAGTHPFSGERTLRFAEPANAATVRLNTPELQVHGLPPAEVPDFLDDLLRRLYDPSFVYAHEWQAGDYVIADNHVLLHGRTAYRSQLPRRLWRIHILTGPGARL